MGAGKSSVLEAICFALFGTFPALQQKKLKLDNILTRWPRASSAQVELEFELDGKRYKVSRKIERDKGTTVAELKCDGQLLESPNSQRVTEMLEKILKIDYELFSQIIYAEQNKLDYFLTIARGKRRAHFDELLRINKFESARESAVKLGNRLKERRKLTKEEFERLAEQLGAADLAALKIEISRSERELAEIELNLGTARAEIGKAQTALKRLKEKAERHRQMRERLLGARAKEQHLSAQLEKVGDISHYKREAVDEEIAALQKNLEAQRELERSLITLEQRTAELASRLKEIDEDIYDLETKKEKFSALDEIEKKLTSLQLLKDELKESASSARTRLEEAKASLAELQRAGAVCPICDTPLEEQKKAALLVKRASQIAELESALKDLDDKLVAALKELMHSESKAKDLRKFAGVQEELEAKSERREKVVADLALAKKELEAARGNFSGERAEAFEREKRRLEKIRDALELFEERKRTAAEISDAEKEIASLGFDEENLKEAESRVYDLEKKLEVFVERRNSLVTLLNERRERLKEIEAKQDLLEKMRSDVEKLERLEDEMSRFRSILESTQIALREQFITSINQLMREIWQTLYPYGDYVDVRLAITDDYVLQLRNASDEWVDVEGQVSGGERMTAALTLRLALASLLAPHLKWLVLDEPTHNLDQNAVAELAATLREKITALVDQVFLITHDEMLAEAVTGKLYKLERGDGKKEPTKVLAVDAS